MGLTTLIPLGEVSCKTKNQHKNFEIFVLVLMLRRERDSNPRRLLHLNGFQDRRNRPLCHLSGAKVQNFLITKQNISFCRAVNTKSVILAIMGNLRTALVILNWNGRQLLERFLPGIIKHTPANVEVIIADNASHDDSVSFLEKHYPGIRTIYMQQNLGFAGGYNEALEHVEADVFVLLNSDMEVSELWMEAGLALLETDPNIAALQPKIRSLENKEYFEYAGAAGGFLDHLGYPFCRGRLFNTIEKDTGQYDDVCEVFWASGAAMFIRAEAFKKAGGFDGRFFAHMEEVEFCWRLHNLGYKVMYCPQSVVYHLGGGSLPKSNPKKTFYNFRNSLWMLAKQLPAGRFYGWILPRLLLDVIALLKFLFQGKVNDSMAVIRAHLAFFFNFRRMRQHSAGQKRALPDLLFRKSIVLEYYLRGKKLFPQLDFRASSAKR